MGEGVSPPAIAALSSEFAAARIDLDMFRAGGSAAARTHRRPAASGCRANICRFGCHMALTCPHGVKSKVRPTVAQRVTRALRLLPTRIGVETRSVELTLVGTDLAVARCE